MCPQLICIIGFGRLEARHGAIPHVSYSREGHTSLPQFFNENFCDVAFHFSYRLSFSFHQL